MSDDSPLVALSLGRFELTWDPGRANLSHVIAATLFYTGLDATVGLSPAWTVGFVAAFVVLTVYSRRRRAYRAARDRRIDLERTDEEA